MRGIGLVRGGQNAISKSGLDGAAYDLGGYYCSDLLSAIGPGKLECATAGGQSGTGDHCSKGVQNMLFGFFDDVVRQSTSASRTHVGAELLHKRADALSGIVGSQKAGRRSDAQRKCGQD